MISPSSSSCQSPRECESNGGVPYNYCSDVGGGASNRPEWSHHHVRGRVHSTGDLWGTLESYTVNVFGSNSSVDLTGLEEYVNYTISVHAYTYMGVGPYSVDMIVLTFQESKWNANILI